MSAGDTGWRTVSLRDIASRPQYGWTSSARLEAHGPLLLRTTDITKGPIDWATVPHSVEPPRDISKFLLHDADIVVSRAGSVGMSSLIRNPPESIFASYLMRLHPGPEVLPEYLRLFLQSPDYWRQISNITDGIAIPNINATKLAAVRIPLPTFLEQRRIVDLLEDHLSRLDAAQVDLHKAISKTYILAKSQLWQAMHTGAPAVELASIAEVKLGRQRAPKYHHGDQMVPYLRAANVDWNRLRLDDVKQMNFTDSEKENYLLQPGDILLTEASGSAAEVGKSAIYRGTPAGVCFQKTLLRVRSHGPDPEFLQKYLLAEATAGRFIAHAPGVGIHHLTRIRLLRWPIELPNHETQVRAARAASDALTQAEELRCQLHIAARRTDTLRRSMLATAFSGGLTGRSSDLDRVRELAGV